MKRLIQRIRLGVRSLRRTPGFAVTAVLTLVLGIGLSVAADREDLRLLGHA